MRLSYKQIDDKRVYGDIAKMIFNPGFKELIDDQRFVKFFKLIDDYKLYLFYELLDCADLHFLLENFSFLNKNMTNRLFIFLRDVFL